MPQNFFLKLSVLWLWPVSNFTAPECVFPPFHPFPTFLCGFHCISLNTVQLKIYLPPRVSDLWLPLGFSHTLTLVPSPRPSCLLLKNTNPRLLRAQGDVQPYRPVPLFMTLLAAESSCSLTGGCSCFEAFTGFKIFGSHVPSKIKKKKGEVYRLVKKYENVQPIESVVCHLPRNAFGV